MQKLMIYRSEKNQIESEGKKIQKRPANFLSIEVPHTHEKVDIRIAENSERKAGKRHWI